MTCKNSDAGTTCLSINIEGDTRGNAKVVVTRAQVRKSKYEMYRTTGRSFLRGTHA